MLILFYLLLFLLPTQLGRHFWPFWSTQDGIRIDYLSPTLYTTDILILLIIFFALISSKRKEYFFATKKFILITALTILLWSVSIYLSINPFFGWYELVKLVEFIVLFTLGRNLLKSNSVFKTSAIVFSLGLILQIIIACTQVFLQHTIGGIVWLLGERTFSSGTPGIATLHLGDSLILRGYGTLPHPNVLAGFLLVGTIWMSYMKFQKKLLKIYQYVFYFLAVIGLISTMSRLHIVLALVFLLWKLIKNKYIFLSTIVIFCLLVMIFGRNNLNLILSDPSLQDRIFLLSSAWQQIVNHPLLGLGFAKFITGSHVSVLNSSGIPQPVHNIFIILLMSVGVIGSIPVIVSLAHLLSDAIKNTLSLWMLLLIVILGSFDHYFLTLQQGQLLLVVVCLLITRDNTSHE